ncbi:MAG: ubiquinol-cytochrome c reductase iron-sulfur subunit [Gammaproteobacteria bacterium]|nr:MAG: ubiquinol-cytochrome c reductase iron-sulfur subunit [Gammaproteobacteria bacterium]
MSDEQDIDRSRRRLIVATAGLGAIGTAALATPFIMSWMPSARARAAGVPIEIDISRLEPGQSVKKAWRGKPIVVVRRTRSMLKGIEVVDPEMADPQSEKSIQPAYVDNKSRAIKSEYLVLIGLCTHLGCSPSNKFKVGPASDMGPDWQGGFYCPCHGSKFDLAGRVYKNVPAPTNLVVPPHGYKSDTVLVIGVDQPDLDKAKGAA